MTVETLEKANAINTEIQRLKEEVTWLNSCASNGWFQRVIFGVNKAFLYNRNKLYGEEYFALEKEDVEILQNRRILKVRELYEELKNLKDDGMKGGEQG